MNRRDKLLQERQDRIIGYVREGLTSKEIGLREGLEPDNANRIRNELARLHGVTKAPPPKIDDEALPYGVTDGSYQLRGRLGDALYDLLTTKKMHKLEVARATGIPQRIQKKAFEKKGTYDWKLSEIERLAAAHGKPFMQFMQELMAANPLNGGLK